MRHLTSLRGIASLLVVFYHARIYMPVDNLMVLFSSKGYLAVDFFFVLSGFIISFRYQSWFEESIKKNYQAYLMRRFARIFPLHAFIMILYLLLMLALLATGRVSDSSNNVFSFLLKILLIDSWMVGTEYWNSWNVPSWTISAEFMAYLLFPIIASIIFSRPKLYFVLIFIVPIILACFYSISDYRSLGDGISHLGLVRCLTGFIMGMLVFRLFKENVRIKIPMFWLAFISSITSYMVFTTTANYYFVPLLFSIILFLLVTIKSSKFGLLNSRPLVYLGEISFSIYLSHTLILKVYGMFFFDDVIMFNLADILLYPAIVLVFSCFSYSLVEVPMRKKIMKVYDSRKSP